MADTNPFAIPTRRKTYKDTYGVGMSDPNPTGIPEVGTDYTPPTGGINPGGMYSGTGIPTPAPTPAAAPAAPAYAQTAMSGWDQSKWADPTHTTPKYAVGRILSQYPTTPAGVAQALPQIQAQFPGTTFDGKDKLNIPGVGTIDVVVGAEAGGQGFSWQALTDQYGNPIQDGTGTGTSGAGGGAYGDDIRAKISQLLNGGGSPMDSPVYQNSMRAYSTEQQRATESERNAIAERMAASGQANSGAMDSRLLGAEQASGEAKASFGGALAERAMMQQRDEIMQALQIGANLMTEQQRLALTEKLGLINANLQQQGITNQNSIAQQGVTNQNNQYNTTQGWTEAVWQYMMSHPEMFGGA